jgi:hypothetical protein
MEVSVSDDRAREDIAFIRATIEAGRSYATSLGSDLIVWGVAVAIGHLGTYAFDRYRIGPSPDWLWLPCIGLPWLYTLRRYGARFAEHRSSPVQNLMATAQRMLWLGIGVFLMILAAAVFSLGGIEQGWFNAVVAGVLGTGLFATAWLASLSWLRWVSVVWWSGELVLYALRQRPEAMLISAGLMLFLFAGPGLVLVIRKRRRFAA